MMDTLDTARALEKQGFTQSQAEGLAYALKSAVTDGVATKSDIVTLKADIGSIKADVVTLEANLKSEIASLKLWLIGSIIAVAAFAITIDKLVK